MNNSAKYAIDYFTGAIAAIFEPGKIPSGLKTPLDQLKNATRNPVRNVMFNMRGPLPEYQDAVADMSDPAFRWYLLMMHSILPDDTGELHHVKLLPQNYFDGYTETDGASAIQFLKSHGVSVSAIAAFWNGDLDDVKTNYRDDMKAARIFWLRGNGRNGNMPRLEDLLMECVQVGAFIRSSKGWEVFVPRDTPGEIPPIKDLHFRYWLTCKYVAEHERWEKREKIRMAAAASAAPDKTVVGSRFAEAHDEQPSTGPRLISMFRRRF